jgi:hypothetical protein
MAVMLTMALEVMAVDYKPIPPYPKNAPGPFYVEDGSCVICEAPYHEAPDVMAHDEEGGGHCYFQRQPETREEVERTISACCVSCVSAVRYSGNDSEILRRFRELGNIDACDALATEWHKPVIQDISWESLTLKEKLESARRAVVAKRESPKEAGPHPLFDRELDGWKHPSI